MDNLQDENKTANESKTDGQETENLSEETSANDAFKMEWQGENDVRPDFYENERKMRLQAKRQKKKTLFTLSFVGLLLDFFYGLGFFLCLPVFCLAVVEQAKEKKEGTPSTQLGWATGASGIGALIGFFFFLLTI